jgi:L-rhamnose-H+ transport protein
LVTFLIVKNRSLAQFAGAPGINPMGSTEVDGENIGERLNSQTLLKNYILAALAGVIWYFQFFFYSMGQTKMGKDDFSRGARSVQVSRGFCAVKLPLERCSGTAAVC